MNFDIRLRDVLIALGSAGLVGLFCKFAVPRLWPSAPACHDEVFVWAPFEGDDGGSDGLPPRRMKFACPHADQKMEIVGHGALTCKCDGYLRSR